MDASDSQFILPLPLISWAFTVAGLAALFFGAMLLALLRKADRLPDGSVDYTVWNDIILFGVWGISFIAGLGMLNFKSWAPAALEYFCWVLMALTIINALTRAKIMKAKFERDPTAGEFRWGPVIVGSLVVVIPVTSFCGATIATLRDPATLQEFRNSAESRHS